MSKAHDERLQREKQLLATIKDLDEERENEKVRMYVSLGRRNQGTFFAFYVEAKHTIVSLQITKKAGHNRQKAGSRHERR